MIDAGSEHLPRLWMVDRVRAEKFKIDPALELPKEAVRVFANLFQGSTHQSERNRAYDLLGQICARKMRLACSCTARGILRPEISCRTRPGGQSFLMAKMPVSSKRPDHLLSCPFSRRGKIRFDKTARTNRATFAFSGWFCLPIPSDKAQTKPANRTISKPSKKNLPKLSCMFAALLGEAGFAHLVAERKALSGENLYAQFDRLLQASQTFEVVQGLPLQRVFSTSLYKREKKSFKRRIDLRFERSNPNEPRMGFLALYTTIVELRKLEGPSGSVQLASDGLLLPNTLVENYQDTPSLSLVFYGAPGAGHDLVPLKSCTFPVYSGHCFTPVANDMVRQTLKSVLTMRRDLHLKRPDISINIDVPLTRTVLASPDVPDFKIRAVNQTNGEIQTGLILVNDERHLQQSSLRGPLIDQWRQTDGQAVFLVDEEALSEPIDFQNALASCLIS